MPFAFKAISIVYQQFDIFAIIELPHLCIIVLYTYLVPLTVFVLIQLVYSTWLLSNREMYIQENLDISWQLAYMTNTELLYDMQDHWHCQGFMTRFDRPILSLDTHALSKACYPILSRTFGPAIFVWGIVLWIMKLVQAIGLLFMYTFYFDQNYVFDKLSQKNLI
ncbi:uncharacterized protein B0P05DRAFT_572702 [Gilbertella persicaria]|uniref:uncharacterized protein n=1 Tax=Gilbertella persicaria TaxID=101096 RepID=UPI00221E591D|nr:uncharacterized protein B0P05DRAFT_572702 [Gilbertella persicaria]KAI8075367.1 hypothetical protein B0P05DRAFT_572702 [Gilbertella persicaria]